MVRSTASPDGVILGGRVAMVGLAISPDVILPAKWVELDPVGLLKVIGHLLVVNEHYGYLAIEGRAALDESDLVEARRVFDSTLRLSQALQRRAR